MSINFNNNDVISEFSDFQKKLELFTIDNSKAFYFRGEHNADHKYSIPSIYRNFKSENINGGNEEVINEIAIKSDQFYSDLSVHLGDLDLFNLPYSNQLARFQHYQAPTRLLDITSNPLIALFFALEGNSMKNRTIYFYAVNKGEIKYQDGHTVNMEVTANWLNQKDIHDFMMDMHNIKNKKLKFDYENGRHVTEPIARFMDALNLKSKLSEKMTNPLKIFNDLNSSHFVNFVRESPRMQRQQGAFIMPKYLTRLENINDVKNYSKKSFKNMRGLLESDKEKRINDFFDEKLYNSIENATATNEHYRGFIRYTIPYDSVKKMRREINSLGVNAGSVYPDIEHYSKFLIDLYNKR